MPAPTDPTTSDSTQVDRNLLFAVIALQDDLIDQKQFADVCSGWALDIHRSLAGLLVERGWIESRDRDEVDRKITRKIEKHRGDSHATLGAEAGGEVRQILRTIAQTQVAETISVLAPASGHHLRETLIPRDPDAKSSRYTLTRLHAQGGLGKIWIARDTDLNREVALKEIRPDKAASQDSWRRFLKEAQITSQLEHPCIVPVYELARRDQDDQPFYTMRLVRGQNLREAIASFHREAATHGYNRLGFQRDLLEPYMKICEAIGYAHSRGVLHRDLKPENVVLGDHGEVMVLDWGLAKTVDQPDSGERPPEPSVSITAQAETARTISAVGTPAYMAPEQVEARSDLIDTRTDIYGLGGILYEMLTGKPPAQGDTIDQAFRLILRGELPAPRALNPAVPRPLEAICLKALARQREDRYPTAEALAEDVRRWVLDEPVSVYRDPLLARLARWAKRHRTLVVSSAALLGTAVLGLSVGLFLINQERDRTEQNRRQAVANATQALENLRLAQEAADGLLSSVALIDVADIPQMESVRRQLLEQARDDYLHFLDQKGDDPLVRWGAGRSLVRLADIEALLGEIKNAEASYTRGLALLAQLAEQEPGNLDYRRDLAAGRHGLGVLLKDANRYREAQENLKQAVALRSEIQQDDDDLQALADSRYQLATLLARLPGRRADDQLYRAALADLNSLEAKTRKEPELLARHARYRNNEAMLRNALGQSAEAEAALRQIVDDLGPLIEGPESLPGLRWQWARAANNLGALLTHLRPDEAASWLDRAATRLRKLAAEFPRVPQYRAELASVEYNRGLLSRDIDTNAAIPAYRAALDLLDTLVREAPGLPALRQRRALARIDLNSLLADADPMVAETQLRGALDELKALVDEYPGVPEYLSSLGRGHYQLARVLVDNDHPADAVHEARRAAEFHRRVLESWPDSENDRLQLFEDQGILAIAQHAEGRQDEAVATAEGLPRILPRDPEAYLKAAAQIVRFARDAQGPTADSLLARAVKILAEGVDDQVLTSVEQLDFDEFRPLQDRPDFKALRRRLDTGAPTSIEPPITS